MCLLVTAGKHSGMVSTKGCCSRFCYKEISPSKLHVLRQHGNVNTHHSSPRPPFTGPSFSPIRNHNINGKNSGKNIQQTKCRNYGWITNLNTIYVTYLFIILPTEISTTFSVHCHLIWFYPTSPKMTSFGCIPQIHFIPPLFHSFCTNTIAQVYFYCLTVLMDPLELITGYVKKGL